MSLKAVAYYEIECDDCDIRTCDIGEFSSWADDWTAIDEWVNAEGFYSAPIALCYDCAPRCLCGCPQDDEGICGGDHEYSEGVS